MCGYALLTSDIRTGGRQVGPFSALVCNRNLHFTMAPGSCISPITTDLPSTLAEWRAYGTYPLISAWDPLRAWFSLEGLHIFDAKGTTTVKPPVNEFRAYDGTYGTHYAPPHIVHEHRVCGL